MRRRRFEVAVRGTARAEVPNHLCCACGAPFGSGLRSRESVQLPFVQPLNGRLPKYGFPLCVPCGRGAQVRDHFFFYGGVLGMLAYLAVVGWAWSRGDTALTPGGFMQGVMLMLFAGAAGSILGMGAARVLGVALPYVRFANHVAGAVDYQFQAWRPSHGVDDYRTFFLFRNEAYAAAFATANARSRCPGRKRALVPGIPA